MKKEIILDDKNVNITFYFDIKLATIKWKHRNISSDIYRNAFKLLAEYTKKTGVEKVLSDERLNKAISPADRKWFQNYIMPIAEKYGMKCGAIIIKSNAFKKYYLNQIIKWSLKNFSYKLKIFNNYDKAYNWLVNFNE